MEKNTTKEKKKFRFSGVVAFVFAALLLAVLVPVNIIFNMYDKNFDMTEKSKYTFSDTTVKLLEDTADKQIDVYFLYDLDELRDTPEFLALYHTLTQLDEYDNIKLTCFMPDEKPDLVESLNPGGALTPGEGDVFVKCGDVIKQIPADRIFPYDSNGATSYAGEELISGAIKTVTSGSLPTVYFLTGHGEKTIDDNYATFAGVLRSDSYDTASLDLSAEPGVPENAAIVMLAGPQSDISEDEEEKLLEFADGGGSICALIAPVDKEGRFENIEDLLGRYELGIDYNIVRETSPERMLNNREYEQDDKVFQAEITPATDSFTVDFVTEIINLAEEGGLQCGISDTRSLYQQMDTGNANIEKSSILTTSYAKLADGTAGTEDGSSPFTTVSVPMGGDDETEREAQDLSGVQLELGFYSYNKENGSKLIAFGTTDLIDSEAVSASVSLSQQLLMNSVTWMYNSDVNMNIGNKDTAYDYLTFDSAEKAESTLRIFTVVPFVIAAIGLFVWLKRRHS